MIIPYRQLLPELQHPAADPAIGRWRPGPGNTPLAGAGARVSERACGGERLADGRRKNDLVARPDDRRHCRRARGRSGNQEQEGSRGPRGDGHPSPDGLTGALRKDAENRQQAVAGRCCAQDSLRAGFTATGAGAEAAGSGLRPASSAGRGCYCPGSARRAGAASSGTCHRPAPSVSPALRRRTQPRRRRRRTSDNACKDHRNCSC